MSRFELLESYLAGKETELDEHNDSLGRAAAFAPNERRLTNLGTYRAYVTAYLRSHPKIRQDLTFLIRQLAPGADGLPLEIYVFTNDTVWANYEAIQADIFDHLLAVVPEFWLRVFQRPAGEDIRVLSADPRQPRSNGKQAAVLAAPDT